VSNGCGVDARSELRRLLEQRLEVGETSIVLESMAARDVVVPASAPAVTRTAPATRTTAEGRPTAEPPERDTDRDGPPVGASSAADWRSTLQDGGAQPSPKADRPRTTVAGRPGKVAVTPDAPLPPLGSLDEIRNAVAGCTRCPLYATALNPVPGEGNPHADFMVVGEAPGATEDETGKPFVGRAGQLLTQILSAIQLTREDVFICNVLKHRPPGNRNPEPDEVRACSPYLIRQIELIQPKVILALGTFSAQTLLDTKISIGKLRGQIHRYHGVPVVVTYHPAALLRNPAWKRPTWEDVQLARRILDSAVPGA
jgi:uracil-DNA glycosylase family 4